METIRKVLIAVLLIGATAGFSVEDRFLTNLNSRLAPARTCSNDKKKAADWAADSMRCIDGAATAAKGIVSSELAVEIVFSFYQRCLAAAGWACEEAKPPEQPRGKLFK